MIRSIRTALASLLLAAALAVGVAQAQTIVDVAAGNDDFSTLVTAVQAAGLVDTLSSEGPFTVFAPTNAAFEALPEGTVEALLADIDTLTAILTYHVVAGAVFAEDVVGIDAATSVQGEEIDVTVDGGNVMVNNANVVATDIEASNGVIHVIDAVILPPTVAMQLGFAPMASMSMRGSAITYGVFDTGVAGVSGSVTLYPLGAGTLVEIDLDGTPAGGLHPAHFHVGDCGTGGGIAVPLTTVDGSTGSSLTFADVPVSAIVEGDHYINIHLSTDSLGTIVACGEVGAGVN